MFSQVDRRLWSRLPLGSLPRVMPGRCLLCARAPSKSSGRGQCQGPEWHLFPCPGPQQQGQWAVLGAWWGSTRRGDRGTLRAAGCTWGPWIRLTGLLHMSRHRVCQARQPEQEAAGRGTSCLQTPLPALLARPMDVTGLSPGHAEWGVFFAPGMHAESLGGRQPGAGAVEAASCAHLVGSHVRQSGPKPAPSPQRRRQITL